jgi:hypothetical protein
VSGMLSPELTIDPLDPFYLPSISFGRTRLSKVTFSDVYIIGATDFNLKEIRCDESSVKVLFLANF